jgi:hypothetical protein
LTVRADSAVWPLLDHALQSPAISATVAAEALTMTPHRVRAGIEQLEGAGIVHTNSASRRNRVWLVSDVIDAVERFMDRTQRPRTG